MEDINVKIKINIATNAPISKMITKVKQQLEELAT